VVTTFYTLARILSILFCNVALDIIARRPPSPKGKAKINFNLQVRALALVELIAVGAEALAIAVFGEGNEGGALDGGNAVKDRNADVGLGVVIVQIHVGIVEGVGNGGAIPGGL
jgi:hypothetical protein